MLGFMSAGPCEGCTAGELRIGVKQLAVGSFLGQKLTLQCSQCLYDFKTNGHLAFKPSLLLQVGLLGLLLLSPHRAG